MPYLVQGQNHYLSNHSNIQIGIGYVFGVLMIWKWKAIPSKPLAFLVASEQLLPRPFLEPERPGLVGWMERSYRRLRELISQEETRMKLVHLEGLMEVTVWLVDDHEVAAVGVQVCCT